MGPDPRRSAVPSIEVRPLERRDRDRPIALVNAHIGALLPGAAVSVDAVIADEDDDDIAFATASASASSGASGAAGSGSRRAP